MQGSTKNKNFLECDLKIRIVYYFLFTIFLTYPVPDAINTFLSSLGRLLKNLGSLLNIEPSTSLEYALRPPTIPINSGILVTKERNYIVAIYVIRIL